MSLPRAPKAVVFDMDGLLVDTEAAYRDCMGEAARSMGHVMPMTLSLRMIGLPWAQCHPHMTEHFGAEFPLDAFRERVHALMAVRAAEGIGLKDGVADILDLLDALGLPRAIATSSGHGSVREHLGRSGLLPRFHAVIANGDYQRGKSDPEPYLTAAARLGVAARDCLALEDSHNGVRAASAAGMMTVMIPDLLEADDEMRGLCIAVAQSLHDVRGWLAQISPHRETQHA